jgi:hypothetical protein
VWQGLQVLILCFEDNHFNEYFLKILNTLMFLEYTLTWDELILMCLKENYGQKLAGYNLMVVWIL